MVPGELGGYVVDPSGAVIPNASIEVTNTATGGTWSAATNEQGFWGLAGLPSGNLRITVSSSGFKSSAQNIYYDARHPEHFNVSLSLGAVTQSVEVTGANVMQGSRRIEKDLKKNPPPPPPPPPQASANVFNLQQRVAGVLPVAVDVPRTGTSYRFVRPLVVNEETKLTFTYKTK